MEPKKKTNEEIPNGKLHFLCSARSVTCDGNANNDCRISANTLKFTSFAKAI